MREMYSLNVGRVLPAKGFQAKLLHKLLQRECRGLNNRVYEARDQHLTIREIFLGLKIPKADGTEKRCDYPVGGEFAV
jgi:hypothetical protein